MPLAGISGGVDQATEATELAEAVRTVVREELAPVLDGVESRLEGVEAGMRTLATRMEGMDTRLGRLISANGQAIADLSERVVRLEGAGNPA